MSPLRQAPDQCCSRVHFLAMMIGGFGLTGAARRRKKAANVTFA
jgi:hypothetical protein